MTCVSADELERIARGIIRDRESIIKHNPIGSDEEILLWMFLSCLNSYLSLTDAETPCFTGRPDADTYRNAIRFVLDRRVDDTAAVERILTMLCNAN